MPALCSKPVFMFCQNSYPSPLIFFLMDTCLFDLIFVDSMIAYTVLEKIKIKLAPLWHKKRSYITVYKGMVVYKGLGDLCTFMEKEHL